MKYVIDAKQGKDYDVIVCGAGTAGVASYLCTRDGTSPDQVNVPELRKILTDNGAIL